MATDGTGELFVGGDIDEELCFETPLLNISTVAGNVSFSVDLEWVGHDVSDYIDVEYQIDGGAWIQIPNQFGGGTHTIDYLVNSQSGSATISESGLSGTSTLSVRVCVDTNTSSGGESTTIDDVSVPEVGVSVLPVELISFEAEKKDREVMLKWATASELNNEKFEVQHSTNEKPFEKIGEVEGNLTTLQQSNYSFPHQSPANGINYYRLKQIDLDGKFEYSDVISVLFENNEPSTFNIYPNPTEDGMVFLKYFSNRKSDLTIFVFDVTGKNVLTQEVEIEKGDNQMEFDFSRLEKGVYVLQLESLGKRDHQKLIIN